MKGQIRKHVGKKGVTWQVIVPLGKDPVTGQYKKKWLTAPSKKEAERLLTEELQKVQKGIYTDPGKLTTGELLIRWLETVIKPDREPSTYRCYHVAIHQHIIPVIGAIPLNKLQPLHL